MKVLDLFSGIGGFSLGLERAGMRTTAFCEIEPFCQKVLQKHWPYIPIYKNVCRLTADKLKQDGIEVDLICGGFPCQDISIAGKGIGLDGERSGLWREFARLIGEIRPRYVIVENTAALLFRGLSAVLGDLAKIGYDAEWHCISASSVGARHKRERVWIIAYNARCERRNESPENAGTNYSIWRPQMATRRLHRAMADSYSKRELQQEGAISNEWGWAGNSCKEYQFGGMWSVEPDVGRVADGVPARVDRLRSLGNAVVPQIPEIIGRAIMELEANA